MSGKAKGDRRRWKISLCREEKEWQGSLGTGYYRLACVIAFRTSAMTSSADRPPVTSVFKRVVNHESRYGELCPFVGTYKPISVLDTMPRVHRYGPSLLERSAPTFGVQVRMAGFQHEESLAV